MVFLAFYQRTKLAMKLFLGIGLEHPCFNRRKCSLSVDMVPSSPPPTPICFLCVEVCTDLRFSFCFVSFSSVLVLNGMVPWSRTVWITTSCTNVTTGKANDIWCIGVSAFCILCGYPPFYGETEIEVLLKIRQQSFSIGIPFISMFFS